MPSTLSVLVVEDELTLALDLEAMLTALGHRVVGPVGSVGRAMQLLVDHEIDVALLDANLGSETSGRLALALREQETPFVLISGYDPQHFPDAVFHNAPWLRKPITEADLRACLARAAAPSPAGRSRADVATGAME